MLYVFAAYTFAALVLILYEMKLWGEFCRESQKRRPPAPARAGDAVSR